MKKLLIGSVLFFFLSLNLLANGVAIIDGKKGIYLKLISSKVEVSVENQVAIVLTS